MAIFHLLFLLFSPKMFLTQKSQGKIYIKIYIYIDTHTKNTYVVIQSKAVIVSVILNDQCSWLEDKLQRQYNQKSCMTACKTILPVLLWENMRIFFNINFTGNYTHDQFCLHKWSLLTNNLWLKKWDERKARAPEKKMSSSELR